MINFNRQMDLYSSFNQQDLPCSRETVYHNSQRLLFIYVLPILSGNEWRGLGSQRTSARKCWTIANSVFSIFPFHQLLAIALLTIQLFFRSLLGVQIEARSAFIRPIWNSLSRRLMLPPTIAFVFQLIFIDLFCVDQVTANEVNPNPRYRLLLWLYSCLRIDSKVAFDFFDISRFVRNRKAGNPSFRAHSISPMRSSRFWRPQSIIVDCIMGLSALDLQSLFFSFHQNFQEKCFKLL